MKMLDEQQQYKTPYLVAALCALLLALTSAGGMYLANNHVEQQSDVRNLENEIRLLQEANEVLSQQVRDRGGEPITDWGG